MGWLVTARPSWAFLTIVVLTLVVLPGCDDDDEDNPLQPGSPNTQFTGMFTGPGDGGLMTLSVPLAAADLSAARPAAGSATHSVDAVATLSLDSGGPVNLFGTYTEENDSLYLGGQGYTVTGVYDASEPVPGITGEFAGPLGAGFFDVSIGGSNSIGVLCGEHTQDQITYERMQLGVGMSDIFGFIVIHGETIHFEGTATPLGGGYYTVSATQDLGNGTELFLYGTLNLTAHAFGQWSIQANGVPLEPFGDWYVNTCMTGTTGPN